MTGWRAQQFNFPTEVLPVVLIGTLLDILGRYACNHLQSQLGLTVFRFLFLDMIGTAFSAILVGPWWGASVGIFSALINGNFEDNYFPFGVVNVCGGLAWGYLAFGLNVREALVQQQILPQSLFPRFLALLFSGAVACGLASFTVQAVLYPPMGRPFVYGSWYQNAQGWLSGHLPSLGDERWTLLVGSLSREFLDKSITLCIAFACVTFYRVPPSRVQSAAQTDRLRVDVASIVSFVAVYGVYLAFSRVFRPSILFAGGAKPIEWLTYPSIITLLYFPLILAIIAFLFGVLTQSTDYGRRVEAYRYGRRSQFVMMLSDAPWKFLQQEASHHFAVGKKMYGLAAGVAAWPITKAIGVTLDTGPAYAGTVLVAIVYYYYQNSQMVSTAKKVEDGTRCLLNWTSIGRDSSAAALALDFIAKQLGGVRSRNYWTQSLVFASLEIDRAAPKTRKKDAKQAQPALIAATTDGPGLTSDTQENIQRTVAEFPAQPLFLLDPNARDPNLSSWLADYWRKDTELFLIDWSLAQECVETLGRKDRLTEYQARLRVEMRARCLAGDANIEGDISLKSLADRALPNLAHIMSRMSRGQSVLDLGAGRGRHTLFALKAGLGAIAIERKQEAYDDLKAAVELGGRSDAATLIQADYTTLDISSLGRVDLVISTGVLQHVKSVGELKRHLEGMKSAADRYFARIYIEMLFDMLFDGKPPSDGRIDISRESFENVLLTTFPSPEWVVSRIHGPARRIQNFQHRPRSFYPPADQITLTTAEYFICYAG